MEEQVMKKITLLFSLLILAFACTKESDHTVVPSSEGKTFTANIEKVKTALGAADIVKWSEGDKIRVVGYTNADVNGQAVFKIKSGAGTSSAVFELDEGESLGDYDEYYAFYPSNIALKTAPLPTSLEVSANISNWSSQTAVENGYDSRFAIMTAKENGSGALTFRHGACYFGIQIPGDDITAVQIEFTTSSFQQRPVYSASTGAITAHNSGIKVFKATGTFVKGSYYYLCAIPKTYNNTTCGNVTVTYTQGGIEKSITSTGTASLYAETGKIYDLGCPPISPTITADDVDILKTDTNGSITFVVNDPVVGGELTAALTDGKVNTISNFALGAVGDGTIPFTCDANDGGEKKAYVTLTYTYNTSKTVKKDIVITQEASAIVPHTYTFYVTGNTRTQKEDGTNATSYFTTTGTSRYDCGGSSGNFGVDSYTILGNVYTQSMKLDSENVLSFTTHAGVVSTVRFFGASRTSGKTARMQLKKGDTMVRDATTLTWTDGKADLYDSDVIALDAETTYSIVKKTNDQGLFYVVVTESLP